MIVLGTHEPDWANAMAQAIRTLQERSKSQVGELSAPFDIERYFRQTLLDGHHLDLVISARSIEMTLIHDQQPVVQILDETLAIDDDDFANVAIDHRWVDTIVGRLSDIAASYQDVDMSVSPMAQLQALGADTQRRVIAIYQHATEHFRRGGNGALSLHLTMPTDYWKADFFASDEAGNRLVIADDPAFDQMLEELPPACEIIGREGEADALDLIPLYLKAVRIG